jgi:hypothetical protein
LSPAVSATEWLKSQLGRLGSVQLVERRRIENHAAHLAIPEFGRRRLSGFLQKFLRSVVSPGERPLGIAALVAAQTIRAKLTSRNAFQRPAEVTSVLVPTQI